MEGILSEILQLLDEARDLRNAGLFDDAFAVCDLIADDFGGVDYPEVAEAVAEALLFKGRMLGELDLFDEELEAYNEIGKLYGSNDSPAVVAQVSRACFNTAVAVSQMATADESVTTYHLFIERYESNKIPEIQEQVARAYLNVALIMRHSSRLADALSAFDDLIERYGKNESSEIRSVIVTALASKAGLELELRKPDLAFESASRGLSRGDSGNPLSRFHCHLLRAAALFLKRETASCIDDIESALRVLPEVEEPVQVVASAHLLRTLASVVGNDRILKLVKRSPSAAILSSLVGILEADVGREAEQLRGIEDAAKGLQQDFAHLD